MAGKVQVVAAIIERGGRVLFGKRSPQRLAAPGYWCPVSGRIEPGESQAEAVVREVREEVGLGVRAVRKVGECDTHDGTALIHWWLAEPLDEAPAELLGDEHTELCWVTVEEMRRLEPAFAEDVEIIAGAVGSVARAYDTWSESYDTDLNPTRDLAAKVLRESPPPLAGARVIEVGCGTGQNTTWLAERARSLLALDLSPGMLQKARALVTSDHVRFARHDITAPWPAASGSADVVIALLVLEHIQDLAPIFDEASRVLRPGGELLLAELHPARQMLGKQARYTDPGSGELVHVTAYPHDVADYVNGGVRAGLTLCELGEWRDRGAVFAAPPRLVSARFRRA